ncbi:MAG: hypothetical protein IJX52_05835, partial [Oscillibacter sp.]|nr:hypothetical protein [Oscillibacter sp.]
MKEENTLSQTLKYIFWGHLLLYFNINLGSINILPNWAGYLLLLQALPGLSEEEPSAALLRPLGMGLAVWEGIQWVLKIFGGSIDIYGLGLIASIVSLYFPFQFLTNLASVTQNHGLPQAEDIKRLRTVRTVLCTLVVLPVNWESHILLTVFVYVLALGSGLVVLALCLELHRMRK